MHNLVLLKYSQNKDDIKAIKFDKICCNILGDDLLKTNIGQYPCPVQEIIEEIKYMDQNIILCEKGSVKHPE